MKQGEGGREKQEGKREKERGRKGQEEGTCISCHTCSIQNADAGAPVTNYSRELVFHVLRRK